MMWKTSFGAQMRESYVAGVAILLYISDASTYLWFSSVIYTLEQPDSVIPIGSYDSSWIASMFLIGCGLFAIPSGYLANVWGRKVINLAASCLMILSWIIITAAPSKITLYVIRFVQGAIMSIHHSTLASYVAELASTNKRGTLTSSLSVAWRIGNLYSILCGAYFSYESFIYFTIAPNILAAFLFMWCPESPYFLLMKHRKDEAAQSIAWMRGKSKTDLSIIEEMSTLENSLKEQSLDHLKAFKTIFLTRKGLKALWISLLVGLVDTTIGVSTIMTYEKESVTQMTGSVLEGDLVFSAIGLALAIVVTVSTLLIDKVGRRPLIVNSSAGCSIFLLFTTLFVAAEHFASNLELIKVLQIASYVTIITYVCLATFGCDSVGPALGSELFLTNERPLAGGINCSAAFLVGIVPLYLYPYFESQDTLYAMYIIFFIISLINLAVFYLALPETKGKTFNEIQEIL